MSYDLVALKAYSIIFFFLFNHDDSMRKKRGGSFESRIAADPAGARQLIFSRWLLQVCLIYLFFPAYRPNPPSLFLPHPPTLILSAPHPPRTSPPTPPHHPSVSHPTSHHTHSDGEDCFGFVLTAFTILLTHHPSSFYNVSR